MCDTFTSVPFDIESAKLANAKSVESKQLKREAGTDVSALARKVLVNALLSKNSNVSLRAALAVIAETGLRVEIPRDAALGDATALLPASSKLGASAPPDHPSSQEAHRVSDSDMSANTNFSSPAAQPAENKGVILDEYAVPEGDDGK